MTREEFISAVMEGLTLDRTSPIPNDLHLKIHNLVSIVYSTREQVRGLQSTIEYMDEVARDGGLTIKCRGCGEYYELPCELSEMSHEGNYCNSGHGGAYHCAP